MGRVYPVGNAPQATIGGGARPLPAPPLEMPGYKPFPMSGRSWPVPKPSNDNIPPGGGGPGRVRGLDLNKIIRGAIGLTRGRIIIGAVGIVPGVEPVAIPSPFLAPNGVFSYCANPSGYGGPFSSWLPYFPGGIAPGIQPNACIGLQALPGGNDGMPDPYNAANPAHRANGMGMYRYSNLEQTRYSHIYSIKNGTYGMVAINRLPTQRQAGASVPNPPRPEPPKAGREKKFIIRGGLARALSLLTEAGDFADCMFSGLPGSVKAAAYSDYNGRLGKGAKALLAYDHWHSINWDKVATCVVQNQIEDWGWGRLGRFTAAANQRRGRLAGIEVGPAL